MQHIKYFILQGGTEISSPVRKRILSPLSSTPLSCVQRKILQTTRTMCRLLHQGNRPELGSLLSTGGRSGFICIGARTRWGQYTSLPRKREKDVGNEKSCSILQIENRGKSRLNDLLRAASLWQMHRCSLNHPNPTTAFTWHHLPSCSRASLPTISLLFQASTCHCFEEVPITSS